MFEVWLTQFVANQDKCPSLVPMKTPLKYIGLQRQGPLSRVETGPKRRDLDGPDENHKLLDSYK